MSNKRQKAAAQHATPIFPQLSGEALQRMQHYSGLTVKAFCNKVGISMTTWRRWLEGDGAPSMEQLCIITELAAVYEQHSALTLFREGLSNLLTLLHNAFIDDHPMQAQDVKKALVKIHPVNKKSQKWDK